MTRSMPCLRFTLQVGVTLVLGSTVLGCGRLGYESSGQADAGDSGASGDGSSALRVSAIELYQTCENRRVAEVQDGDRIDVSGSCPGFAVVAVTEPAVVGSVEIVVNGGAQIENQGPYASGGNSETDFLLDPKLIAGTNHVRALPNSGPSLSGTAGEAMTLTFELVTTATAPPTVEGFQLVSAEGLTPLVPLVDGSVVRIADLPTRDVAIAVQTSPRVVGAVSIDVTPAVTEEPSLEEVHPYTLPDTISDDPPTAIPWRITAGSYLVAAEPFALGTTVGGAGVRTEIRFDVVD